LTGVRSLAEANYYFLLPSGFKLWVARLVGRCLSYAETQVVFTKELLFLNEIREKDKIYIFVGTFLGYNMKLALFYNLNVK